MTALAPLGRGRRLFAVLAAFFIFAVG